MVYPVNTITMYMGLEWYDQTYSKVLNPQMDAMHGETEDLTIP